MHLVLCLFVHWNCYFGSTSRLLSGRGVVAAKNCEHSLRIRSFSGSGMAWHGAAALLCAGGGAWLKNEAFCSDAYMYATDTGNNDPADMIATFFFCIT